MSLKFNGIGASAGIGIGTVVVVKEPSLEYKRVKISNPESEIARLQEGLDKTISQTSDMAADMKKRVGEKEAEILEGHMLLLMDPAMTGEMDLERVNILRHKMSAYAKKKDAYLEILSHPGRTAQSEVSPEYGPDDVKAFLSHNRDVEYRMLMEADRSQICS